MLNACASRKTVLRGYLRTAFRVAWFHSHSLHHGSGRNGIFGSPSETGMVSPWLWNVASRCEDAIRLGDGIFLVIAIFSYGF
jgi:hypothetical protein